MNIITVLQFFSYNTCIHNLYKYSYKCLIINLCRLDLEPRALELNSMKITKYIIIGVYDIINLETIRNAIDLVILKYLSLLVG
jgi:hypothetical protein